MSSRRPLGTKIGGRGNSVASRGILLLSLSKLVAAGGESVNVVHCCATSRALFGPISLSGVNGVW